MKLIKDDYYEKQKQDGGKRGTSAMWHDYVAVKFKIAE